MNIDFNKLKPKNLSIVLYIFIGNAELFNFDIFLFILTPAIIILNKNKILNISKNPAPLIIIMMILAYCAFRAPLINVPYFDDYYLWPLKTIICISLLTTENNFKWTTTDTLLLTGICLFLVATGHIEDGRLSSFFGPNMLYRILGFLYAFSIFQYIELTGRKKIITGLISIFALVSSLATGSTGAFITVTLLSFAALYRFSIKAFILTITASIFLIFSIEIMDTNFNLYINDFPTFLSRIFFKLQTETISDRSIGLHKIFSLQPNLLGYNHDDLNSIWTDGYQYPHNIYAELYVFYGYTGIIATTILTYTLIRSIPFIVSGNAFELVFLVMFIGSTLSGDLSDNFGLIALSSIIMMRRPISLLKL